MKLSANNVTLNIGDKIALGVTIEPLNAIFTDVIWSSSDEEIVSVNSGAITAVDRYDYSNNV